MLGEEWRGEERRGDRMLEGEKRREEKREGPKFKNSSLLSYKEEQRLKLQRPRQLGPGESRTKCPV